MEIDLNNLLLYFMNTHEEVYQFVCVYVILSPPTVIAGHGMLRPCRLSEGALVTC